MNNSNSLALAPATAKPDKNVPPQGEWKPTDRWAWSIGLPVSGIARAVAGCIAYHARAETGVAWPGMGTIAKETGFGRTAIIAAVKELERGKHVTVRRFKVGKKNVSNRYQLPPMGNVSASHPSAPDGLPPSAPDGPEQVRTEQVSTKAARQRCHDCGYSWPKAYGPDCYPCQKAKRDAPRRPRGGLPTYHDRPPRPDPPPLTAEQIADLEADAVSNGYHKRAGQWTKTW